MKAVCVVWNVCEIEVWCMRAVCGVCHKDTVCAVNASECSVCVVIV